MKRLTCRDSINGQAYDYKTNQKEILERLCELEEKLESGFLLELPCKIGTKVYSIEKDCGKCPLGHSYWDDWDCDIEGNWDNKIYGEQCKKQFYIEESEFSPNYIDWVYGTKFYNKSKNQDNYECTFFLTKEQAEEKLKEILGE